MVSVKPKHRFEFAVENQNVILRLLSIGVLGEVAVPTAAWSKTAPEANLAIWGVFGAAESDREEQVVVREADVVLPPSFVAALNSREAVSLGLPQTTSLALDMRNRGLIPESDFCVDVRWVRPGGSPVRAEVVGALIRAAGEFRRIPEPLYSIFHAANKLAHPLSEVDRFAALAALREAMPEDAKVPVQSNTYLEDTRIHYASSASLSLGRRDAFDFDPVLFSSAAVNDAEERGELLNEDDDRLLTPSTQKLFAEDRFRRQASGKPVYILRDGEYVFIDPALRPVLAEIRRLQDGTLDERQRFLANPRRVLRENLGEAEAEKLDIERRFVETEQFSTRVAGIDVWRAPVLPWVKPGKNSWFPEAFGLRVGDVVFAVKPEDAQPLHGRFEDAAAAGALTVSVSDLLQPLDPKSAVADVLPVNAQTKEAVEQLASYGAAPQDDTRQANGEARAGEGDEDQPRQGPPLFLLVKENLEEVAFSPIAVGGASAAESATPGLPNRLRATLKPHQVEGFNWLARAYAARRPGVLLADDMGLGKTLQAITFVAWLQDKQSGKSVERAPCLIVAPTGLLQNWREEIERHLDAPRLGEIVLAFGSGLKLLREEGLSGSDIEAGKANLDSASWSHAGVVLTTYETLRDYHFSFAKSPFSLVIFDEIQKLKNPASQLTRASKTLNARFVLGMTGTPVENRLQDLWSIMDVVSPGLLGASKDFERTYSPDNAEGLKALKKFLTDEQDGVPPVMLRRMKEDHLPGLPEKLSHPRRIVMPPVQAAAYRELVDRAIAGRAHLSPTGMLPILHAMRGVSLHPIDPADAPDDLDSYARDSARLNWTLEILDEVANAREKALIFLESLAMQERLAGLIQIRWKLAHAPLRINGSVPGPKRQALVNKFQSTPGRFDVMIISPKAGGVGLNLTAANHVIHLSRWWNPAVEDQSTDRCFRIGQTKSVHVYLPMAEHPDPLIGPSSFDLKLNELLDRKRKLSRDMLAPPDAGNDDISALFDAVSLNASEAVSAEPSAEAPLETLAATVPQTPPEPRPVLTLKQPLSPDARTKVFVAKRGELRPLADIAALFAGKRIRHIRITDPFAFVSPATRAAQIKFLAALRAKALSLDAATFVYDPEPGDISDRDQVHDVRTKGALEFRDSGPPKWAFVPKRKGRHGQDDSHDREVLVDCAALDGSIRTHTIWSGRGLIALVEPDWDLRLTYIGPQY